MIALTGSARVFIYGQPVDMRKGFEGLGALVEQAFSESLVAGGYFAFLNRRQDRIKVLYWDGDGLTIWYKRLERGAFRASQVGHRQVGRREFLMLLEGVTPQRMNRRYNIA